MKFVHKKNRESTVCGFHGHHQLELQSEENQNGQKEETEERELRLEFCFLSAYLAKLPSCMRN